MTQPTTTAPMISERQFWAGAAALLAASILAVYPPSTANAGAFDSVVPATATMHEGVDWSQVPATPVDTGATVGAYDR
jgi:hypothetical protein